MQNGIQYFNCDFLNISKDLIFLGGKMYQKSAEIRHLNGLTRGNPFGQQLEMKLKKKRLNILIAESHWHMFVPKKKDIYT